MVDYKTLRVPKPDYDKARDAKRESETWGEFLQRCSETRPEIREFVDADSLNGDTDIAKKVDRNYEAIKEATDAAQNAAQTVEEVTQG